MSYLIKPVVIVVLSAICMWVIRGYGAYMKKRRLESRELLRLSEAIRKSVATRLQTPKEALSRISCRSGAAEGFRRLVVSGKTLYEAFSETEGSFSLSRGCREMLSEYFASFGKGYLDEEIRCADEFIERYRAEVEREELAGEADERVARSIAIAVTLGIIILII